MNLKIIAITLLGIVTLGCQTREITDVKTPSTSGKLIFKDDFERTQLGGNWERGVGEAGTGKWEIKDGWLHGSAIKNDPLWLKVKIPSDVRVEFDAKSTTPEGDLKFEIFGDGKTHSSGYVVIFGGWKNTLDVIARLDEHGNDRKAQKSVKVQQNKVHKIAAERRGNTLKFFVDGKFVMEFEDAEPLMGESHSFFAFNDWMAPVQFDNIMVYAL